MLEIIVYDTIRKKNIIESKSLMPMGAHDSLVHTLNMMDFINALNSKKERISDHIDWIILHTTNYDS